jgi:folylpolyglutamate synthase
MMASKRAKHSTSVTGTYDEALAKLMLLQSNRTTTQRFEAAASGGAGDGQAAATSPQDLNATAIPEMRAWMQRAGYSPEKDLIKMRHIHVAGTKGKGSVCAYATAMLAEHTRVGTYTSPHLVTPRERIAIDGEPISQDVFATAFFDIWNRFTETAIKEGWPTAEAEGPASKPFFFRFMTIMAWHVFLTQGIKDVVMECGIGGEYDATNVLPAEAVSAAVVTQLGVDHVAMLGDTVEKIAWHKAGVFKYGKKAFTRRLDDQPGVMEVLRSRAHEKGAVLVEVDDAVVDKWGGSPSPRSDGSTSPSPAPFQKQNQALATLAVMEHIGVRALVEAALLDLPLEAYTSLQKMQLPGRQEIYQEQSATWLFDGAHTKESLEHVAKWLVGQIAADETVILVFNQQDRDASELLTSFVGAVRAASDRNDIFSHALFSTNHKTFLDDNGKAWDLTAQEKTRDTMKQLLPSCQVAVTSNVMDTIMEARRLADLYGSKTKILVTGSMHLVGNIKYALNPTHGMT